MIFIIGVCFLTANLYAGVGGTIKHESATGWDVSTGQLTAAGLANDLCTISGPNGEVIGYEFNCYGSGMCYNIDGTHLTINLAEPGFGPCGIFVQIHKH